MNSIIISSITIYFKVKLLTLLFLLSFFPVFAQVRTLLVLLLYFYFILFRSTSLSLLLFIFFIDITLTRTFIQLSFHFSIRTSEDIISIWNRTAENLEANNKIR